MACTLSEHKTRREAAPQAVPRRGSRPPSPPSAESAAHTHTHTHTHKNIFFSSFFFELFFSSSAEQRSKKPGRDCLRVFRRRASPAHLEVALGDAKLCGEALPLRDLHRLLLAPSEKFATCCQFLECSFSALSKSILRIKLWTIFELHKS